MTNPIYPTSYLINALSSLTENKLLARLAYLDNELDLAKENDVWIDEWVAIERSDILDLLFSNGSIGINY